MVVISNAITESNGCVLEGRVEIHESRVVNKVTGEGTLGSVLTDADCIAVRIRDFAALEGYITAVNLSVAAAVGYSVPVLCKNLSL